jgi:toxin ParE1/3/4
MKYRVLLTDHAVRDLEELDAYLLAKEGLHGADHVLDEIGSALLKLEDLPERGPHPPELAALGIREYREVFVKPYRIIYRVQNEHVYIYLIADGRRDMQDLLSRRLLSA